MQPSQAPKKKPSAGGTSAATMRGAAKPEVVDRITAGQDEQNWDAWYSDNYMARAHCGLRGLQVDRQIQGPNGVWRKFTDQVVHTDPNDIASINGESGGPVVAVDGSKVRARGTITSLDKQTNCNGRISADAGRRTPACFNGMWHIPISQTLADG
ncbi:hypothetical protein ACIRYZ_38555 [Kitasatospora sp. NPDC101155]|uniref:hypothetical protein n=1 Tax=Kitasatospora sp. NPDC101155 TaxID=3364097 RepID=UPI00381D94EA